MTVRTLALMGHPVLLTPAAPVADVAAPEIQELIDDMLATMAAADGIGLAAPQVHRSLRIIVALEIRDRAERDAGTAHVLVNPELTLLGEPTELAFEGCLSIPDLRGLVPRHRRVAFRAIDRAGAAVGGRCRWPVRTGTAARGGSPRRHPVSDADDRSAPSCLHQRAAPAHGVAGP